MNYYYIMNKTIIMLNFITNSSVLKLNKEKIQPKSFEILKWKLIQILLNRYKTNKFLVFFGPVETDSVPKKSFWITQSHQKLFYNGGISAIIFLSQSSCISCLVS